MMKQQDHKRICLGAFAGAHGVKGDAKLKAFTQSPEAIAAYGPVESEDGARRFALAIVKVLKDGFVLARAPEIASREDAESLKGMRVYVSRAALPAPDEDEYYLEDLVGLAAKDEDGAPLGVIKAVYNFGADDLLELAEIPGVKGVRLIAFTRANVPAIDLKDGSITVRRAGVDPAGNQKSPPR